MSHPRRVPSAVAAAILVGLAALAGAARALAQGAGARPVPAPEPLAAAPAPDVEAALRWLSARQAEAGHFGQNDQLALTAQAGLAFLAAGSTPEHGPYREEVRRIVHFFLKFQTTQGAYVHPSSGYSAIHNHGFATLFMASVYGECGEYLDEKVGRSVRRAIGPILASQHDNGGFGYFLYKKVPPRNVMWTADEASTTIAVAQALRAARDGGIAIERRALDRASDYLARSQHETGGFVYSIGQYRVSGEEGGTTPSFAITAACTAVLHALGRYDGPLGERAIAWIERFPPRRNERFYYYGHYYAAQVMHMVGGDRGRRWLAEIKAELAKRQLASGSWPVDGTDTMFPPDSRILNTAFAVQIALVDQGTLPIHER